MKISCRLLFICLLTVLSGCDRLNKPRDVVTYTAIVADGRLYRLNEMDGSIVELKDGELHPISEASIRLKAGELYESESGVPILYKGALKFVTGEAAILEKYNIEEETWRHMTDAEKQLFRK